MKTGPDRFTDAESKDSKVSALQHGAIIRKMIWLAGILVLWAIIIFGVQSLYWHEQHSATARIEILGSHDHFDPRVWFQDKFSPTLACSVQEHAEAFKSRDLARSVVAALPPGSFQELQLAMSRKPTSDRGVSAMAKSLSPFREYHTDESSCEPTDYVCQRLSVAPVSGCNMLDITIQAPTQALSVQLLKEYLRIFSARNLEKRRLQTMASADNLNDGVTETLKQLKEAEAALLDFVVENGFSATEGSGLGRVFRLINRHIEGSRQVSNVGDQKPDFKELTDLKALDLEKLEAEYSGMAAALGMNINMAQKTTISDFFLHPPFDSVIGILRFPEISP